MPGERQMPTVRLRRLAAELPLDRLERMTRVVPLAAVPEVLAAGLTPTVYRPEGVAALAAAAEDQGRSAVGVHLKVDTGMHRVGADPDRAVDLALALTASGGLRLEGLWTHLAAADELAHPFTAEQLARFEEVRGRLRAQGIVPPLVHVANSAGALSHPRARYDLVRCGISLYGYTPFARGDLPAGAGEVPLRPVLSLRARVSLVRELAAGERPSYGLRRPLQQRSWVATVPVGYADGVPRGLLDGGVGALVGGRRRPLAGAVTMDQIVLDCGPDPDVAPGDEVVLIGNQGGERVGADDWAAALGTISYEVLCGIGARVPRVPVRGGRPVVGAGSGGL